MNKIELKGTYGYENFIDKNEQLELLYWVSENENKFEKNGDNRKYGILSNYENAPIELIKKIKQRIINLENISDWKVEPVFKDYIGINTKGGSIHLHTDKNDEPYIHTRYNVVLSYPEKGGESIYGDNINELKENMVWKCVAGKVLHGSNPVQSSKPRITLSLGFLIK